MPLGFSKKHKDEADVETSKSSLFGRKSKTSSPANANPYAQPAVADVYAQDSRPPSYASGGAPPGLPRAGKTPVPPGGYMQNEYGGQAGYGAANRYGDETAGGLPSGPAARRPGGYGGMGSAEPVNDDAGKNALFGGAAARAQQRQQQQAQPQQQPASGGYGSYGGGYGGANGGANGSSNDSSALFGGAAERAQQRSGGYGGYGGAGGAAGGYNPEDNGGYGKYEDRELTAEEQEEEDVTAAKQEIKFLKQEDVGRTRNALRIAQQAEETGLATLQRLGQQGERIHNTERNLDMASIQNRAAQEKAKELETLNRSMFAVHINNPFNANSRKAAAEQAALDKHQEERMQREETRGQQYRTATRQQEAAANLQRAGRGAGGMPKRDLAQRQKFQFEADSDDEQMEDEIEDNLDLLHGAAKRLNMIARAQGDEVSAHIEHIDRVTGKTDKVDDQLALNRARLEAISKRG